MEEGEPEVVGRPKKRGAAKPKLGAQKGGEVTKEQTRKVSRRKVAKTDGAVISAETENGV